jgi:hypothetical protein
MKKILLLFFALILLFTLSCKSTIDNNGNKLFLSGFPKTDLPNSKDKKLLENGRDSIDYYYGIKTPVDYNKARKVALLEIIENNNKGYRNENGFYVLMMIYANGFGVNRNLNISRHMLNIVMSGGMEAHDFEIWEQTFKDIEKSKNTTIVFDICEKPYTQIYNTYCSNIHLLVDETKRETQIKDYISKLSANEKIAFENLSKTADAFITAHLVNEMERRGSGSGEFMNEEENSLKRTFIDSLNKFESEQFPDYTEEQYQTSEKELTDTYTKIMDCKNFDFGETTQEKIKKTEEAWDAYKNAWIKFGMLRYPKVNINTWKTWLIIPRIEQIKFFPECIEQI